jgi:hypothetical protein
MAGSLFSFGFVVNTVSVKKNSGNKYSEYCAKSVLSTRTTIYGNDNPTTPQYRGLVEETVIQRMGTILSNAKTL